MVPKAAPDEHDDRFDHPYPASETDGTGASAIEPWAAPSRGGDETWDRGRTAQPGGAGAYAVEPGGVYDPGDPAGQPQPRMEGTRTLAWWLDDLITIPGTRIGIGLDAVIGMVPVLGDAAGPVLSGAILVEGVRQGIPLTVILRMVFNLLLDAGLGTLPVVGDLADVAHRANRKNMRLIEQAVADPEHVRRTSFAYLVTAGTLVAVATFGLLALGALAIWFVWRSLATVF